MIGYAVELKGVDEQIRKLQGFEQVMQAEFVPAMTDSIFWIEGGAKVKAPKNTGELASHITGEVQIITGGEVIGIVGNPLEYAPPVEFGARPHFPPLAPLAFWVQRQLGISGWDGIRATIMIARKIAARGTRAQPFMKPAFDEARPKILQRFAQAVERIAERLEVHSGN